MAHLLPQQESIVLDFKTSLRAGLLVILWVPSSRLCVAMLKAENRMTRCASVKRYRPTLTAWTVSEIIRD